MSNVGLKGFFVCIHYRIPPCDPQALVEPATLIYAHCVLFRLSLATKEGAEFHTRVDIMQTGAAHVERSLGVAGAQGNASSGVEVTLE